MSIRHPALVDLVNRVTAGEPLTEQDRELLDAYAAPEPGTVEDQLDGHTREAVAEFTGRDDVWSPTRAARALLATLTTAS